MTPRDIKTVKVVTYSSGVDAYGQKRAIESSTRDTEMSIYIYQQQEVQDPRYNKAEYIGLTKDSNITISNSIKNGSVYYQIIHIIPTRRWNTLLLREMK